MLQFYLAALKSRGKEGNDERKRRTRVMLASRSNPRSFESSKIASAETVTLTMHSSEAFNRRNNYSKGVVSNPF